MLRRKVRKGGQKTKGKVRKIQRLKVESCEGRWKV
jgi:hypothetical protein